MNLFNSFTFGRLIKTFIPGFLWVIAAIYASDIYFFTQEDSRLADHYRDQSDALAVALAIVLSIFFGLISNTIVFSGLNNMFVRDVEKRKDTNGIFSLKTKIEEIIRNYYWQKINNIRKALPGNDQTRPKMTDADKASFHNIDTEIMILDRYDSGKIMHVQEQYWYYMELHINLSLSFFVIMATHILWKVIVDGCNFTLFNGLSYIVVLLGIRALVRVARTNYLRHTTKVTSLLCAFLAECSVTEDDNGSSLAERETL